MENRKSHDELSEEDIEDLKGRKEDLVREINEYNREREQIKATLGNIGGEKYQKTDKIMNYIFTALIVIILVVDLAFDFMPTLISLELGVLLVSIKIIWMIHSQHKFNHFQFWVLNSIEFRMTQMDTRVRKIEKHTKKLEEHSEK